MSEQVNMNRNTVRTHDATVDPTLSRTGAAYLCLAVVSALTAVAFAGIYGTGLVLQHRMEVAVSAPATSTMAVFVLLMAVVCGHCARQFVRLRKLSQSANEIGDIQ